jgi:lantibiotic transport system permease protein
MGREFFFSLSSEWLKRKRSYTMPLVAGSALFIPAIIFLARFRRIDALPSLYQAPRFWEGVWLQAWESMAFIILPMAIMMIASLIAQIEYRNNAWKQVHATPQSLGTIFAAKLAVILILVVQLVVWFNVALYLAGILPALIFTRVDAPASPIPFAHFARRDLAFIIDVLPIVAFQYLLALRFRSFVAPLGIGMALWILSVGTMRWKYNYLIPYSYAGIDYLMVEYNRTLVLPANTQVIAATCFLAITTAGFVLYAFRSDKG